MGTSAFFHHLCFLARLVRELQREGKDPHKVDKCGALRTCDRNSKDMARLEWSWVGRRG
jgi:hypothetical protein